MSDTTITPAPTRISITAERLRVEAGTQLLHQPSFIPDPSVATTNPSLWKNTILPTISTYTFELASLTDVDFFRALLARTELPNLYAAITSITFTQFYQFAGIRDNRTSNPYLTFAKALPSLEHLTLTFHTAGITTSVYTEKERIAIENQGKLEASKALQVLKKKDIVAFYKLEDVFELKNAEKMTVSLVNSELAGHFVKKGDVLAVFGEICEFFQEGFTKLGREVEVEMVVVPLPYTG